MRRRLRSRPDALRQRDRLRLQRHALRRRAGALRDLRGPVRRARAAALERRSTSTAGGPSDEEIVRRWLGRDDPAACGRRERIERYRGRGRRRRDDHRSASARPCASRPAHVPVAIVSGARAPRSSRWSRRPASRTISRAIVRVGRRRRRQAASRGLPARRSSCSASPPGERARVRGHRGRRRLGQGRRAARLRRHAARSRRSGSPPPTSWSTAIDVATRAAAARVTRDRPPRAHRGPAREHAARVRAGDRGRRRLRRARRARRRATASSSSPTTAARRRTALPDARGGARALPRPDRRDGRAEDAVPLPAARRRRADGASCSTTTPSSSASSAARSRRRARCGPACGRCSTSASASRSARARGAWAAGFDDRRVDAARDRARAAARARDDRLHGQRAGSACSSSRALGVDRRSSPTVRIWLCGHAVDPEAEQPRAVRRDARDDALPDRQRLAARGRAGRRSGRARGRSPSARVTGPRNVCVSTSPASVFSAGASPFAAAVELERLGPHEHEHALAAPAARAPRRREAVTPPCSTSPVAAVDDRRLEPVHRADELGDERRRRRRCTSRSACPSARSGRRT